MNFAAEEPVRNPYDVESADATNDMTAFEFSDEAFAFLENVTEAATLPAKTEARVRIMDVYVNQVDGIQRFIKADKNGHNYVAFKLKIVDVPSIPTFNAAEYKTMKQMLYIPDPSQYSHADQEKSTKRAQQWKSFMTAFGIKLTKKGNFMDMIGKEAVAILGVEEDEQYGAKNRVSKWILTN